MFSSSHIEISKSAYKNNVNYLRQVIGSGVRFSSVIKGNAYGHGTDLIIPVAEGAGIDHFSVFSAEEAYEAKKYVTDKSDIMIMGHMDATQVEWAVENGIEFFVYDTDRIENAIHAAKTTGVKARIHLEVETGFHRTGIEYENREQFANILKDNATLLNFKGLCTHYAGAESLANYLRIKNQALQFKKFSNYFIRKGLKPALKHTACSAAALTYPTTIMDMVRFGIAQYGKMKKISRKEHKEK
jgi:alanine racemase